jgi:hypothetical protein
MKDDTIRIAVTDLIATNNRLRRAVKNRDAEIASLRVEVDNLKRDLAEADSLRVQQAEDLENVWPLVSPRPPRGARRSEQHRLLRRSACRWNRRRSSS